ncbi:hypothetical protein B0T20DRAFT_409057 [Sordaria brevicollis]|uniref:Uncharacterized protein n=1 Tax=Sordaria brevicollis TaxID=83679 RepID=A0AAE0UCU1_SORBR|nr:hypothetical protein B0T20DRAFT_409057 [Sordaria brevicollis]
MHLQCVSALVLRSISHATPPRPFSGGCSFPFASIQVDFSSFVNFAPQTLFAFVFTSIHCVCFRPANNPWTLILAFSVSL